MRKRKILTTLFLALAPTIALAAPPSPPPVPGEVRTLALIFETNEIDSASGKRIANQLDAHLRSALTNAGYRVFEDSRFADAHLRVSIALTDEIARNYEVEIELELARDVEPSLIVEAIICEACTEALVVESVLGEQSRVIVELDERTAIPEPTPQKPPEPRPAPQPRWPKQRPIAYAGLATTGLGVIATIVGASLWGVGEIGKGFDLPPNDNYLDVRPAGQVLTVVGMLATVTGGSLLAVDVFGRQRRIGTMSFRTSPGYAGLHFQARF